MQDLELKILKYLADHPKAVSSSTLAGFCQVSQKTVQGRIADLNSDLQDSGVSISGRTSSGYRLVFADEQKKEAFLDRLENQINNPLFERDTDYQVNYIVRRVLSASGYVSLDRLCDELYYSKNSVRKELEAADRWLQGFGLSLKLRKGYGYSVEGSEWKKRLALLSQDKLFVNLPAEVQEKEKDYIQMLGIKERMQRRWYLDILEYFRRSSSLALSAIDFPSVAYYISLIPTREKYQNQIYFSSDQEKALVRSDLLKEARRILHLFDGQIRVTDLETESFAMTLLAFRTVTSCDQLTEAEWESLRADTEGLVSFLKECVPAFDHLDETFIKRLQVQWYNVCIRILFDMIPDEEFLRPSHTFPYCAPVPELNEALRQYASRRFHKPVRAEQIQPLPYLFQGWAEDHQAEASSRRAAVVSIYGYSYACYLAKKIKEQYRTVMGETIALEYTQMSEDLDGTFDYLITDMRSNMWPDLKVCKILRLEVTEDWHMRIPDLNP